MTNHLTRRGMTAVASGVCTVMLTASAVAADRINDRISNLERIQGNLLDAPIQRTFNRDVIHHSLASASGRQQVIVRLNLDAAANASGNASGMATRKHDIAMQQRDFLQRCGAAVPDMRVVAQTQLVLNAVFIEVDVAHLDAIARDPAVSRIAPVANYQVDLSETVPYIGAAAVQGTGIDGSGITVAVLDSGLDYNHANLGGSGDPADFAANDPNVIEEGSFPTAKVIGGFDFVGSFWPDGPLAPDPDPIDDGSGGGHGTHVSDIIGGVGGVAPGVALVGVKVCSSVSPSCSGIALIQGMEFAVDPNGDGDPEDAVDIINMSLGSNYGQPFDDDLVAAVNNASGLGVLTVASAGNGSDKPYVTGTPAAAATALSVAQTQVPSAALQFLRLGDLLTQAEFQLWSVRLTETISGALQYGGQGVMKIEGEPDIIVEGNTNGCLPFPENSLDGLVVLVDRGACNFTLKIKNIGAAGGVLGIIGLVAPGAPFAGGDGGDRPITIPGFMIDQANSNAYKSMVGSTVIADPDVNQPLVMQMVGSSSRGPRNGDNGVKPEIGAPGASVSAVAGTGTDVAAFGGTSGAAPMVSGSAALIAQAYEGEASPQLIKALLFNNGETDIDTNLVAGAAPITRIGGGEVRVDSSLMANGAAWDKDTGGALSFGQIDAAGEVKLKRTLVVTNTGGEKARYDLSSSFRFADDEASGAVEVQITPDHVTVKPGKAKKVQVELRIDPANLPGNFMNSGGDGANPDALTANEYDGYITLDDGVQPIHVPWHVLPRQAAKVKVKGKLKAGGSTLKVENKGAGVAQMDAYALLAVSGNLAEGPVGGQAPTPDIRAVGINTFPVPAGFCSGQESFVWVFAINTWERQTHLLPVSHQVELDIDQNGSVDYVVLNRDLSGLGTISDGRQVTYAFDVANGTASIFFFAEHATNTGNTVLTICGEQVGLTGTDMLATNVGMNVVAQDFYFGGPGDEITGLTVTPLGERFFAQTSGDLAAEEKGSIGIQDLGEFPGNSPELGVLLFTNGDRGPGAHGGATQKTEATIIGLKGADLSALNGDNDDEEVEVEDDEEDSDD